MSQNKEKLENIRDTFDEIIKMSVTMEQEQPYIPSDEELEKMGVPLPPADMYDRIMKECRKEENRPLGGKKRKVTRRIILIAAVAAVLFGALSAQAVKVYVFKREHHFSDNAIRISSGNSGVYTYDTGEENSYKDAERDLGVAILKPAYLPEDYRYERMRTYENDHVIMFYENSEKNRMIKMTQTLLKGEIQSGDIVDAKREDTHKYILNAQNTQITVEEYKQSGEDTQWRCAVWEDEKLMYQVDANCEKEEFEKFVKGLH